MLLVHNGADDPEPLRTAMTELLRPLAEPDRTRSRDYLFGTIVSQLVPDEARILAALAGGQRFAVVDVVAKDRRPLHGPHRARPTCRRSGDAAGVASPAEHRHLPRPGCAASGWSRSARTGGQRPRRRSTVQLADDAGVARRASDGERASAAARGSCARRVRLSPLGREFWAACAPTGFGRSGGRRS